jgi:hypothetical protein
MLALHAWPATHGMARQMVSRALLAHQHGQHIVPVPAQAPWVKNPLIN